MTVVTLRSEDEATCGERREKAVFEDGNGDTSP